MAQAIETTDLATCNLMLVRPSILGLSADLECQILNQRRWRWALVCPKIEGLQGGKSNFGVECLPTSRRQGVL